MARTISTIRNVVFVALACFLLTGCVGNAADFQKDKDMVVPDWYQRCYFDLEFWDGNFVLNSILWKSYVLHFIFWIGVSCMVFSSPFRQVAGQNAEGLAGATYFWGMLLPLILSILFWVVVRIFVSFFSSHYVPYDFIVFLLLLAEYAVATSVLFASFAGWFTRPSNIQAQVPQTDSAIAQAASASRHAKVMRAMAKALFVAVASAIGTKLGGLIGGIIVFVISAGISSFFDTSSFASQESNSAP